jgi:hypothetical protein
MHTGIAIAASQAGRIETDRKIANAASADGNSASSPHERSEMRVAPPFTLHIAALHAGYATAALTIADHAFFEPRNNASPDANTMDGQEQPVLKVVPTAAVLEFRASAASRHETHTLTQ